MNRKKKQKKQQNIEDFYELYPFAGGETYATLVDLTDIKSYFGLMYLRASLKQNLFSSRNIW